MLNSDDAVQCGLVPNAQIGMGGAGPGCFKAGTDVTDGESLLQPVLVLYGA